MFKITEENQVIVDRILDCFRGHRRGEVVTHETLVRITEMNPPDPEYFRIVRAARKQFQDESGITIMPEKGVGFRLLTHRETLLDHHFHRARKIRTQTRFDERAARLLPEHELEFQERRLRVALIEEQRELKKRLSESERFLDLLMTPTRTNPK